MAEDSKIHTGHRRRMRSRVAENGFSSLEPHEALECLLYITNARKNTNRMAHELIDRFGEPPKNVQNLLAVAELKALAHCAYVTELKQMGDSVRVTLQQHAKIDVARIPELLQKYRDELKFQMESLAFVYTPRRRNSKEKIDLLEKSHALVEDLLQITQE